MMAAMVVSISQLSSMSNKRLSWNRKSSLLAGKGIGLSSLQMFTRLEERLKGIDENRGAYDERSFKRLADWKPGYSNATCFTPIKHLWLNVIRKIKGGNAFPLLSTPTHTPAYVQATELVRRLAVYQKAETKPCPWDFQLAIARCAMEDKEEAIATARQLLQDDTCISLCSCWMKTRYPNRPTIIRLPGWPPDW